jgi:hypothetical protein
MLSRLGSHNRQLGGFTAEQPQTGAYVSIAYRRCLRVTGKPESAGINRHVVGDARALQERK